MVTVDVVSAVTQALCGAPKEAANGNADLFDGVDEHLERVDNMPDYRGPYCPCGSHDEAEWSWRDHPAANQNNQAPLAVPIIQRLVN